jgi:Fe-S-cluster-containing hydrogenase component 2
MFRTDGQDSFFGEYLYDITVPKDHFLHRLRAEILRLAIQGSIKIGRIQALMPIILKWRVDKWWMLPIASLMLMRRRIRIDGEYKGPRDPDAAWGNRGQKKIKTTEGKWVQATYWTNLQYPLKCRWFGQVLDGWRAYMGIATSGILSGQELVATPGVPSKTRMDRGKVAVIECSQEIPCNPCETVCPVNAISVGEPLTRLPILDEEKCTGCGRCLSICPGLAIFLVDVTYSPEEASVAFPYEMLPLPNRGQRVIALGRDGRALGEARVLSVQNRRIDNRTPIITVAVPKAQAMQVRNIRCR